MSGRQSSCCASASRAAEEDLVFCRATDAEGNTQPLEQWWTLGGMGNNVAQRIAVLARAG